VPISTPTVLAVDQRLLILLRRWLQAVAPEEGCALLLGSREPGGCWRLQRLWPCCNCWPRPQQRHRRFAVDPREQLQAQRWGRARGLELLGVAHSHPASAPRPSATDCRLCLAPALMVIQGPEGWPQAWWLPQQDAQPQPLPWRMGD